MATEVNIPVSVPSKKGEREDDALSSEFLEEKVTEHPGNKVKQLESGANQSLETSSHVAETVNTRLETDAQTDEGGNFFQALSVPMVTADKHSNTPESCEATTTEDQEERKKSTIETFTERETNDDEGVEVIASKEASANELQPKTEDRSIVEGISAQNEGSIVHALGLVKDSDKDIGITEFCNKDEGMGGSPNAKAEADKEEDLQGENYNSEAKETESVKTRETMEKDTEEIRPPVETEEKTEYEGLQDGITTDVCVSQQTKPEEGATDDEEKKDEKVIKSENNQMKTIGRPLVKEACEETGIEKAEPEERLESSDSMAPSKKEIASKGEDQEKEQVVYILGKDQDDEDDFTGSQDATCEDIKETTSQHPITVDYFKEHDLNETPGEILKEEAEDKSVDIKEARGHCENEANDKSEQNPMGSVNEIVHSCSEIEQEEQIEEIRPSAEIEKKTDQKGPLHAITTDACTTTQTKSEVKTPEYEEKDQEEATENHDGQKEKSNNSPSMDEVSEETASKKDGSREEAKISDSYSMTLKEKAMAILNDEDQEKAQDVNMLEKDQSEDNITSSENATCEGDLQKKNHHSESSEAELETKEIIEEDTEEIRSGVQTLEKTEQERMIHVIPTALCISTPMEPIEGTAENKEKNKEGDIGSDDGEMKKSGSPVVEEVHEEVVPEKAESEEVLKLSDNSSLALNENETESKDGDQEKEQELYVSGKGHGGGDDGTSPQNAFSEDREETTIDQHASTLAYFKSGQDLNAMPKYILKEETEDKSNDPQEASEQSENEAKDKRENPEESLNKIEQSCSEIEQQEKVTEEIKPRVETEDKTEQQGLLHAITTDACISTQTQSHEEGVEHEEETTESDDGQKKQSDNLLVRDICDERDSEKVVIEGVKHSGNFSLNQCEETIATLSKDESQEKEHELSTPEKYQVEDDITCSQDSASMEDLQAKNYSDEGRESKFVAARESTEEVTAEIKSSIERKENLEQQGLLNGITTDACISTQTESQVGTTGHEEKNGEEAIESDDGQKENSESFLVKDICEDTASEKVEYEEVEHSNSSSMKLDEKAITSKEEDQESEQKVNMSEEGQVEDNVTSLHDSTFEGGLQEKKHHSEGNEPEVIKTKESLVGDTEETISIVETVEKTEQQLLTHDTTTEVCISTQTEPEETTEGNEKKNDIEAVESDGGQANKSEIPMVKEVCDETVSEKVDELEEGLKHSDSSSVALNENESASKDEYRDKEQELQMLEKGHDGGDDVAISQNASNEATKVDYLDEVQGLCALPKDILKEEANDRTIDPQEAGEQYENEADNRGGKQEEHAEEIKPSVETEGNKEDQGFMHTNVSDAISTQTKSQEESQLETTKHEDKDEEVTESDDGRKDMFNNPSIEEVCGEIGIEKTESKGLELYGIANMELAENAVAILSKDEDQEKEQELYMSEQDQSEDGITCSQDATSVEDLQSKAPEFVKARENMEEDMEVIKSSVKSKEKAEQQGLLHDVTTDVCILTQTESQEEKTKNEEETMESVDGRKEKSDNDLGKEVCEDAGIEKAESEEGMKHSDSSNMKLNENAPLSIDEDQRKAQELNMPEEYQDDDGVTRSQDASSKEDLEGKNQDGDYNEPKSVETRESIKEDTEVIRTNVDTEEITEQQGSLHAITTDVFTMAQKEPQEETTETEEKSEESIENYDGEKEKPVIPSIKEVFEETSIENAESKEGVKLFDSSTRKLNEKTIATVKDEEQEKDQEVNISAKGSQVATTHEDLQEKNYFKEDNESEFVKTRQSLERDIEEISSNFETKGNSEHQGLPHATMNDICSSTQTENEEETAENEEKNDEEAIHNDVGQIKKSEDPLIKEVIDAVGLRKAEFEEGVKHFDISSPTMFENEIVSKDEDQEKEQELKMSEVQGGGDDVISSQMAQNEDIKETTIQYATTTLEETEDTSVEAQEAKQCENGAKDRREQEPEDSVNKPVHSQPEIGEENIVQDEADAGNCKEEVCFEKSKYEAGDAGDGTACETAGGTQKILSGNKDDPTAYESKSVEKIPHDIEMSCDKAGSPLAEETEDEKFDKKEHQHMDLETHMQKGDVTKKVDEEHFYETYEQKSIDASEQEKSIPGELKARVEKELQEDSRVHQLEYGSENPCITTQDILEEVGEKTTMKPEITKQAVQESPSETNKELETKLDAEDQANRTDDRSGMKDAVVLTEKMSSELGQHMEQNVEIQASQTKTMSEEDEVQKKDKDVPHGSIEDTNDDATKEEKLFLDGRTREIKISTLEHEIIAEQNDGLDEGSKEKFKDSNETTAVEPQEDIMHSSSLDTSTDVTSGLGKSKAESENLPIDLGSVSEKQIPGVVPISEGSNLEEECLISKTATYVDEETRTLTKEISYDEIYSDPRHVGNQEVTNIKVDAQIGQEDLQAAEDISCESKASSTTQSLKMDMKEDPEKSVGISGEVKNDSVDEAPKQERIPALEDTASIESPVKLSYIESTYPSESEKSPMQALESVCEVQTPEEVACSKNSKETEECIDLPTAEYMDENNVEEEQQIKTNEISSAKKKEQAMESKQVTEHPSISYLDEVLIEEELGRSSEHENTTDEGRSVTDPYQDPVADIRISESCPPEEENVRQAPTRSDDTKRSDPNTEEKALIKENLELPGELKPTCELMNEEDQVNEAKPQPEQSDITSEDISNFQLLESKLEHTSEKDLVAGRRDMEDVTLTPEFQTNSTEDQNEIMKNIILTDKVDVKTEKEKERNEVEVQVSEEDSCPTELEKTAKSYQKELASEIGYLKSAPVGNTEVTEVKAESQIELENKQAAEDLSCLLKASSTIGASNTEMSEGTGQTVTIIGEVKDDSVDEASKYEKVPALEDVMALELQVNSPEIESIDTPSYGQDGMKLREGMPQSTQETVDLKGGLISQLTLTDREMLEGATENREEATDHELEKKEKDDELISEIQTPEEILRMEMKEEHVEAINDSCETLTGGSSSEKLLDETKETDKEDIEVIVRQEEKTIEDSYQDTMAEVTVDERLSQREEVKEPIEKLASMASPEKLTSPRAEGQTNELVLETDETKAEHSSISNEDRIPELMEEKVTKISSQDQKNVKERYIEEELQDNFGVENKEARRGNEVVEEVIANELLLEEKAKESKSINDSTNQEASCIHNQSTSTINEVCQIRRLNSSPNELLEAKGSVEDTEDPKLMAENLDVKAEKFTVLKGPNEDKTQNAEKTSEIVASDFERLEHTVTEEKIIEADANKEKETLEEPHADDPAKSTCDLTVSSTELDKDVRSEESSAHGDMHKLDEKSTQVSKLTSEVVEVAAEGGEASAISTENVQEASPNMLLVKHDPEITTTIEKIEDEIKDKDETPVDMHLLTRTKEAACLSNEKTGEIQVSTLDSETDEGKQNGLGDMLNKEREAVLPVQPQEHISNIKFVDPPSDVESRQQRELMHFDSQEPSEDIELLSQNDKKIADPVILPSAEKEIIKRLDKQVEEAPATDVQKHEKGLDHTTKARIVDVVSSAECPEIEQQHLDTKEATLESINQTNQSEQKKEADEIIQSEITTEQVLEQTIAHKDIANEVLVVSVANEEEKRGHLQDRSKEQEYSRERTYQDLEAIKEPFQNEKLYDKVEKADPIDIQGETMAEGNLHEEETEERTNITETPVNLHHREKGDETKCKGTSIEAAIPVEYVKSSDVELESGMDVPVSKCAATRNPEVRSADLEGPSVMDATADKAVYNENPNDKTAEAHVAEKEVLKEDVHLKSTCDRSKTTEKVSGMNQEPFNLPSTTERSMELDAPVMHGTAATEDVQISQKRVTEDPLKISQVQPETETYKINVCTVEKQLPNKPHQNESIESKPLTGNINASHEQGEPTTKSLYAEAEDLKATDVSGTRLQCSSEVVKEGKKISDEKKSETPKPATILFTDKLHESTQENSEVAENLIGEGVPSPTKVQQVDKEETGDSGAKTDEENEEEEDDEDNQKMGSGSDALVMVEASKDMEVKVHKKSHNILSGVGSKVKHSIAKVKKAITGKSSHPKPPSPKERD